jgi:hypothetical protein
VIFTVAAILVWMAQIASGVEKRKDARLVIKNAQVLLLIQVLDAHADTIGIVLHVKAPTIASGATILAFVKKRATLGPALHLLDSLAALTAALMEIKAVRFAMI